MIFLATMKAHTTKTSFFIAIFLFSTIFILSFFLSLGHFGPFGSLPYLPHSWHLAFSFSLFVLYLFILMAQFFSNYLYHLCIISNWCDTVLKPIKNHIILLGQIIWDMNHKFFIGSITYEPKSYIQIQSPSKFKIDSSVSFLIDSNILLWKLLLSFNKDKAVCGAY